ncbi:MAG: hypothetical protein ACOCRX_08665 [Candidatus Woesearchaeota archaeon]
MNRGEIVRQLNTRLNPGSVYILLAHILSEVYDDEQIEEFIKTMEERQKEDK